MRVERNTEEKGRACTTNDRGKEDIWKGSNQQRRRLNWQTTRH